MLSVSRHNSLQDNVSSDSYKNIVTDCKIDEPYIYDTVDNPEIKIGATSKSEESLFSKMKYEVNRLYSFQGKWPLSEIKPESLSAAGLFYLQHEDRVQCPFCFVIIFNWTSTDKPLREHMKKSPKCPFLMGLNVGNIPIISRDREHVSMNPVLKQISPKRTSVNYKPKHPRMADIRRRLLTYSGWKLQSPCPQQLAECGLYYSGVADVTICFFCGGSLGNWDPHDNPWDEHHKYFADCAYLSLPRSKSLHLSSLKSSTATTKSTSNSSHQMPSCDITAEVVEQAMNIFPKPVVLDAVKRKGGSLFSLQELCDDILQQNQKQKIEAATLSAVSNTAQSDAKVVSNTEATSDILFCKICMDNERGVVFQPCGHFVSCWKCAQMISDCPVCRRPIINVIRTYFS